MNVKIASLPPSQWAEYRALRLEALQNEPQAFCSSYAEMYAKPEAYWRSRLEEAGDGKNWLLFARDEKGDLQGMVGAAIESPGTAALISLYVTKKARGQGIGKDLMAALLDELSRAGTVSMISLQVNSIQAAAVSLYKNNGFKITKKLRYFSGDGKEHDDYIMEREATKLNGSQNARR